MNTPLLFADVESKMEKTIREKLTKLRTKYDREGYSGIIDPDFKFGTPRAIFHIAKSLARSDGRNRVTELYVEEAADMYCETRRDLFETWEDRGVRYGIETVDMKLKNESRSRRAVYDFIDKNGNPTRGEIREAFPNLSDSAFEKDLNWLVSERLVYSSSALDDRFSATYQK